MIKLRGPHISDVDAILKWENDPAVQCHSSEAQTYSRGEIELFVERSHNLIDHSQQRFIIANQQDEPIGCVDLYDFDDMRRMAYVGILVYENKRRGVGLHSLKLLAEYVRRVYHLRELRAEIPSENTSAIGLFEGAGYGKISERIYGLFL